MANRKETEAFILKYIDKILPGSNNKEIYQKMFKRMSNKQFEEYMEDLYNERKHLVLIKPTKVGKPLSLKRNMGIAKELGYSFFQRLWLGPDGDIPRYLTPNKYLILKLPFRRTSQLLIKKISIANNDKAIDQLTGQPAGDSSAAGVSYTELQVLTDIGLTKTAEELIKLRGGDVGGYRALKQSIIKYGKGTQELAKQYATGVVSKQTLRNFITACHLKNNL